MSRNEFLRDKPGKRNRNVLFDISNFLIPAVFVVTGLIVSTQKFAYMLNYNYYYTGEPVYILKHALFGLPEGYCFYNPLKALLSLASGLLDDNIQNVVLPTLFWLLGFVVIAVISFFIMSALRGYGLNKNDNLYGTARWGKRKDLKKFGLLQKSGVVLAQTDDAIVESHVNPENASVSLSLKKAADLVCHSGGTNTLLLAPTRSGKGVGSVIPTCLSYLPSKDVPNIGHMIIFDPKGELWNITAGYRKQFSHVLKFSPVSKDTVRFNPLQEMKRNEGLQSEIDLIASIIFSGGSKGDGKKDFWDNMAMSLFNSVIYHILTCDKYTREDRTISNAIHILALASAEKTKDADGNETESGGEEFLNEMMESEHTDENGVHQEYMDHYVREGAAKIKAMNPKVRSDVYSTLFAQVNLFTDAYISNLTSESDFHLEDFYTSEYPITLYLTVPYGQMERVMPVFSLLINFMLNRFSSGEIRLGEKEKKLSYRMLFLLDEFPALGKGGQQIHNNLGVLAGYGITFFLIAQSISQLDTIYGKDHSFLSNCKTVMIYAPGELEPAKRFSEMIGKESVTKESLSASGSRYAVAFNNLNASSQEVARDLINADELMKLPPDVALIMNQGMPPYLAKKCVYYEDPRFKDIAYSDRKVTTKKRIGIKAWKKLKFLGNEYEEGEFIVSIPLLFGPKEEARKTTGFPAPYDINDLLDECRNLPSNRNRKLVAYNDQNKKLQDEAKKKKAEEEEILVTRVEDQDIGFNPVDYILAMNEGEDYESPSITINNDEEPPPSVIEFNLNTFCKQLKEGEN